MGILFEPRGKLESVFDTNDLQNYGLSNIGINDTVIKVYDSPEIPLNYIRARIIANQPASRIHFIYDNS